MASGGEPTVEGMNIDGMRDYLVRTENVLAHRYGDIDHEVVYDVLRNDLRWFERFQQELAQWFQQLEP